MFVSTYILHSDEGSLDPAVPLVTPRPCPFSLMSPHYLNNISCCILIKLLSALSNVKLSKVTPKSTVQLSRTHKNKIKSKSQVDSVSSSVHLPPK